MADLIDRQMAIDALDTGLWGVKWDKALATAMLKNLPSAERKGHWILQEDRTKKLYGWHICSECGAWIGEPANFCSECGADMRGDNDD